MCPGFEKGAKPLGEDFPWASKSVTAERANVKDQLDAMTCARYIIDHTGVVTANVRGNLGTEWAYALLSRCHHINAEHIVHDAKLCHF